MKAKEIIKIIKTMDGFLKDNLEAIKYLNIQRRMGLLSFRIMERMTSRLEHSILF